jgi:hypothetical protein
MTCGSASAGLGDLPAISDDDCLDGDIASLCGVCLHGLDNLHAAGNLRATAFNFDQEILRGWRDTTGERSRDDTRNVHEEKGGGRRRNNVRSALHFRQTTRSMMCRV